MIVALLTLPARSPAAVLVLFAAVTLAGVAYVAVRALRRHRQHAAQRQVEGLAPAVGRVSLEKPDPREDTMRITGSDLPTRAGCVVLPDRVTQAFEAVPIHTDAPRADELTYVVPAAGEVGAETAELVDRLRDLPVLVWDGSDLHDVETDGGEDPPQDEARVLAHSRRGRDDDVGDPPSGGAVPPADPVAVPRYTYLSTTPWPPLRYVLPKDWMLRTGRRVVAYFRAPVPKRTLFRAQRPVSAAREAFLAVRSDLDKASGDAAAVWERQPWLRRSASSTATPARGRHRADDRSSRRRVAA